MPKSFPSSDRATKEGRAARDRGNPIHANPYTAQDVFEMIAYGQWRDAWLARDKEIREAIAKRGA